MVRLRAKHNQLQLTVYSRARAFAEKQRTHDKHNASKIVHLRSNAVNINLIAQCRDTPLEGVAARKRDSDWLVVNTSDRTASWCTPRGRPALAHLEGGLLAHVSRTACGVAPCEADVLASPT